MLFFKFHKGSRHARGLLNPLECAGIVKSLLSDGTEKNLRRKGNFFLNFGRNRELKLYTKKRSTLVDFVTPPFPKERFFLPFNEIEPCDSLTSAVWISHWFFHYMQ